MKVAVLGAAGFIGSYVTKALVGHTVIPVTRATVDLTDFDKVRSWLIATVPDVVVNCATAGGKQTLGKNNYQDVQNNLAVFLNFYNNRDCFHKFINVGSGAEFDCSSNINLAREDAIFKSTPTDSYGYSKNVIARICASTPDFYTLRLFGCFDRSEPDFRLLKKLQNSQTLSVTDRQFDFISLSDFTRILGYVISNPVEFQDINCVYDTKMFLNEFLTLYCQVHGTPPSFSIVGVNENNYTGDPGRLKSLGIKLDGIVKGLMEYEPS